MVDEAEPGPLTIDYALFDVSWEMTEEELYYKLLSNVEAPMAPAAAFADAVKYIMRRLGPPRT